MPLIEEMARHGAWLFRWRSYFPLVLLVPLAFALPTFKYLGNSHLYQELWCCACLAVSFLGLAIRCAVVGFVPRGTSGRNTHRGQIAEQLNVTGLYSLVRHPLYVGNFLIWLGFALFFPVWWLITIYVLFFWLYYERIALAEEDFLRQKFGEAFIRWAAETPAFIPRLTRWKPPATRFSWRKVLRQEYSGLFGIVVMFTLFETAESLIIERRLYLEPHWIVFAAAGLSCYLMLRTLKKCTHVLDVR